MSNHCARPGSNNILMKYAPPEIVLKGMHVNVNFEI
jgi:hypothetical protein